MCFLLKGRRTGPWNYGTKFASSAKMQFLETRVVSNSSTMERSRAPRTHVRVSRLVHLPEIPRGIEVVVVPELSRCPIFGPPPLEVPRVVILEDVEDDMPPMDDEPVEVRPRSLGRAGRLLQAMRRAESLRPGEPRRRRQLVAAPPTPLREDSLPNPGASSSSSDRIPSGTPPPGYQEQDPLVELGQLTSSWKTPGEILVYLLSMLVGKEN